MQNADMKINSAVERLNRILPLAARHHALDTSLQDLHKTILHAYVHRGRTLNRNEMALLVDNIDAAVKILQHNDLVVFDASGEPIGAYPFSMSERDHRVTVNGHSVNCMCALDALAVSPMFNLPTTVSSICHVTHAPITLQLSESGSCIGHQAGDVHFGINWDAASDNSCCADSLCTEMVFLKDATIANTWLSVAPDQRQIFTLHEAMGFAARFFVPLLHD